MKVTTIEVGRVPESLQRDYVPYRDMFQTMFSSTGLAFEHEAVDVLGGQALPDPEGLEAIAITGSSAGVYEDHAWLDPLRDFIRKAYEARTPMLGICFGHQVMADALGGEVRKSEKGWGLGRHQYRVTARPQFMAGAPETLSIVCSHQDQVIVAPSEAEVVLASEFTPNAGLFYRTGQALSFQPHPEFDDSYGAALVELRRGRASDEVIAKAMASFASTSDSARLRDYIAQFMHEAGARR
ncbi:gamma-glutamyl-gamma-aminobutyrate hydrolase family protein [Devosia sp. XK-2]|uniref:glutamine amidotransferase-related protein n=1 Tax=Devosia sp. XK-2 TaxID=3126689 RepID=UPI0030D44942